MKKNKIAAFFLAIIAMIIIFVIAFFGTDFVMKLVVGHSNEVEVPQLVGSNINVAIQRGKAANLYVEVEKRVSSVTLRLFDGESKELLTDYTWDTTKIPEELELIQKGRIGLRHMSTRQFIYSNFKVERL